MQTDWRDLIKPKAVEFDEKEVTPTYGRFFAEPLERGYGITVGNTLRRILLASLPGFAITAVRIKGVLHEFSTLPGVKEDITDLVLNLKEVRLRLHEGDELTATLQAKGEAVVTARDISGGPSLEILTPEQHIATLDKGAELDMELVIKRGRGYVPAERGNEDEPIGTIRLDSIFSPIRKCNFTVDDTRVGQNVDFDRLTIEIETNGSVTPDEALSTAAMIMQEQLDLFVNFTNEEKPLPQTPASEWDIPVETLNLSVRSFNCLKRAGISKVSELLDMTEDEIIKMRNFGKKSLDEIKQVLEERGLSLRQ